VPHLHEEGIGTHAPAGLDLARPGFLAGTAHEEERNQVDEPAEEQRPVGEPVPRMRLAAGEEHGVIHR